VVATLRVRWVGGLVIGIITSIVSAISAITDVWHIIFTMIITIWVVATGWVTSIRFV